MTLPKSFGYLALATAALLLVPLVAMQFTREVNWTFSDFVVAGGLLFGAGSLFLLVARQGGCLLYRLGVAAAVGAGLLLVWANLAVGLVGSEHNPVNLLFGAVLVVALGGAVAARFRPLGMARAMWAAAGTYAVVLALALLVWPPSAATAEPPVPLLNALLANALLLAGWVVAALLFGQAGRSSRPQFGQLAA